MYEIGNAICPIEIKSGSTLNEDYFKNFDKLKTA